MTTPTHGADVPALRLTAQATCDAAEVLIATDLRVSGALSALTWNGPDAMRARQAWDAEHGPALFAAARVLATAGEQLLAEAGDQEQTSARDGAPAGPPPGAVPASIRSTLGAELFSIRSILGALTPSAETIERIRGAITKANHLSNVNTLIDLVPIPPVVSTSIGVLGAADDVASFRTARAEGDLVEQVRSGGSLAAAAPGVVNPKLGAATSLLWAGSWAAGEGINTAMAGTRFEENYRERNDAILDTVGAWGMLATPGTLIVAGAETAWQTISGSGSGEADTEESDGGR